MPRFTFTLRQLLAAVFWFLLTVGMFTANAYVWTSSNNDHLRLVSTFISLCIGVPLCLGLCVGTFLGRRAGCGGALAVLGLLIAALVGITNGAFIAASILAIGSGLLGLASVRESADVHASRRRAPFGVATTLLGIAVSVASAVPAIIYVAFAVVCVGAFLIGRAAGGASPGACKRDAPK